MVTEDENLSELADKTKIKAMQREVRDLGKRKLKMERLYEKMCGKAYKKPITDVDEEISEESNANSNDGSDGNSNYNSNENPESYSGLKKFRQNN